MDPDAFLDSLNPVSWKLGLERMNLLSGELGRPQDAFDSIHVVGTNGKTSVARMTAAIVTAHGRRTGCSLSPHMNHWSERVLIDGVEVDPARFGEAVERTAAAADRLRLRLEPGDEVTQFELATAAAFLVLAEAGVELALIEAGLGGRLDATNTINSLATVLTTIGRDHTEYLGETELEIAAEKLAVLRPGTTLIIGCLSAEVEQLARETAQAVGAEVVRAVDPGPGAGGGSFQRRNFAVAESAAGLYLGRIDPDLTAEVAANTVIPGRLERIGAEPPTFADVAHNRAGAAALAAALPEVVGDGPVIVCFAVLADKDAAGMLAELAGVVDRAVFTDLPVSLLSARGRPGARARPPEELIELASREGIPGEIVVDPREAIHRTRRLAVEAGGTALLTGSHFLLSVET